MISLCAILFVNLQHVTIDCKKTEKLGYMKRFLGFLSALMAMSCLSAQQVNTFEMRHFKNDAKANGVTDFHGETEVFDTDQCNMVYLFPSGKVMATGARVSRPS